MTTYLTNQPDARAPSPTALAGGGSLSLLWAQLRADVTAARREPEFLVGVIAFPVMLYAMFGLPNARAMLPGDVSVSAMMMLSFAAYGLLGISIFVFGVDTAQERGKGWHRLLRATPLPAWVYFTSRILMAALTGAVTIALMFAVGVGLGNVTFSAAQLLTLFGTLLLGGLAFSTLGFAFGYLVRPRAASSLANLIYLPLSFASGFFFPLSQLPAFLRDLAPYLPTYHYGQLVWKATGEPQAAQAFTGIASGDTALHLAWVVGTFVVFGILAVLAYGRDRRRAR